MKYLVGNSWERGVELVRQTSVFWERDRAVWEETLIAADVILFKNASPHSNAVCACQRAYSFPQPASCFSHVALYVGDGKICHSMPVSKDHFNGVQVESLSSIDDGQELAVLRLAEFSNLSNQWVADKIAQEALSLLGQPYNYRAIAILAAAACRNAISKGMANVGISNVLSAFSKPSTFSIKSYEPASGFLCSDFIFDCFDSVLTTENPFNEPELMVAPNRLPAEFYMNSRFLTVAVSVELPQNETSSEEIDLPPETYL